VGRVLGVGVAVPAAGGEALGGRTEEGTSLPGGDLGCHLGGEVMALVDYPTYAGG
jgi:hypothetical protein